MFTSAFFQVNKILRTNEHTQELTEGSVKSYDSNQLASNSPIEDTRSEASCKYTPGSLFGVFDGHAGGGCAQVSAKRLMRYIASTLISKEILRKQINNGAVSSSFLTCHNDKVDFVAEIYDIYEKSFSKYAHELVEQIPGDFKIPEALEHAFLRLDEDFSNEAKENPSTRTLSVAMSGCVACVAHIDGANLHVAGTGDCSAVLGTVTDTGQWMPKKLTIEHNADNVAEVRRILGEHPSNERDSVIKVERLLGQLAPLRALGDFRYKWTLDTINELVVPRYGERVIPPNYHTPPYLTARPEVMHHILTPRDRFLIIASDGLWDLMSPLQVVRLVGEHMSGKAFLQPLKLPKQEVNLGEISQTLAYRKAGLSKKPMDKNVATHLIRNALGGTEYGIEHSKLSHMLSLPQDIVRLFRDDITVTVVYFDAEFLRHCTT